jgi:hypothetical protein
LDNLAAGLLAGLEGCEGDRIGVRHMPASAPGDVAALARAAPGLLWRFRTIVVDAGRLALAESDSAALADAATNGTRVVVTGPRAAAGAFPPMLVLYEPAFARALCASVYALEPGQSLLAVTPRTGEGLYGPIRHALRWRAAWAEPEEGDLTSVPG